MLAVAFALTALATSQPQADAARTEACKSNRPVSISDPLDRPAPKRLGDLPPAHQELAVLRSVGGCAVSTVVRYAPLTHERIVTYEPAGGANMQGTVTRLQIPGF